MNLKEKLKDRLTEKELSYLIRSFEILGDIAVIQVPKLLENKKMIIARAVKEQHKHIKTVLRKIEKVDTEFRVPRYELLIGTGTETIYKENDCRYTLDPTLVYFSEKLGTERARILEQVREGETIHAWFAGVGPYPILIAKNKSVKIIAIEKNPKACKYLEKNVLLNKVQDKIKIYEGDVREIAPKIGVLADRTIMPLPKTSELFLDLALTYTKTGGIVHYYCFGTEDELEIIKAKIKEESKKQKKEVDFLGAYKCGVLGPKIYRFCIDFQIN